MEKTKRVGKFFVELEEGDQYIIIRDEDGHMFGNIYKGRTGRHWYNSLNRVWKVQQFLGEEI